MNDPFNKAPRYTAAERGWNPERKPSGPTTLDGIVGLSLIALLIWLIIKALQFLL